MVHIEPDRFDLIVLGTGLEESILAAYVQLSLSLLMLTNVR